MTAMVWGQFVFLAIGISVTSWVASMLKRHGVLFSTKGDKYDVETGPAMCHLLVVGFCLVCFGIISIALSFGGNAISIQECVEVFSSKLGWVIVLIGILHFFMVSVLVGMSRRYTSPLSGYRPNPATGTAPVLNADDNISQDSSGAKPV